jgi:hypothetical protein
MISNKTARNTLYAWHGGQCSAFYAAASSGLVESFDAIKDEINKCIRAVETTKGYTKKDHEQLIKLLDWIKHKESKAKHKVIAAGTSYFILPWVSRSY